MDVISKLTTIHDYWNKSQLFGTPGIIYIMSKDWFYHISKYFKLYNKEEIDARDPTHKFSFFMNCIMENSQNLYIQYIKVWLSMKPW